MADISTNSKITSLPNVNYDYVVVFVLVISGYLSYILTILICAYWLKPFLEVRQPTGRNPQHNRRLREAIVGEESSRSGINSVEDLTPFGSISEEMIEEDIAVEDLETREKYRFLKIIGEGRVGKVYLARQKDKDELVAVKLVAKNIAPAFITLREWMVLRLVTYCPFVVQCLVRYETPESYCFVMEYLPGGSLTSLLKEYKTLPESYVYSLLAEIVLAVEGLHNCGILIRDLKTDNVMFDGDGHIKLVDFGSSEVGMFGDRKIRRGRADVLYLAPEMLLDLPYGHGADLWDLGILLWSLLFGENPFKRCDESAVMTAILYDQLPESKLQEVSPEAASLLKALLEKEPLSRIKLNAVKEHAFFKSVDWDQTKAKSKSLPQLISIPPGKE